MPRIEACEKSYRILKPVIDILSKDPDGLPPVISCRDYGPSAYMKLGDWEQAERIITFCINAGAYKYPDDTDSSAGKSELEYLTIYQKIGTYAIAFIKENPGFLKKNIYSALLPKIGEENIHILKAFMRDTYVFHKQPYKSTNQLYYIERK